MKYGATDAVDSAASRGRGGRTTTIVLGVIAVAMAVAVGLYGFTQWWQARELHEQRAAATQAARQTGVNMASLNYKQIQKGIDRVLGGMTGDAKDSYASRAKVIADTATKAKSVSHVDQVRAGVLSMDQDSAEVIVAVNATTTSPKFKKGSPRYYRFEMDLARVGDRWLVSKMGLVP